MLSKDHLLEAIYEAIDEVNQQFPVEQRLEKGLKTSLLGGESKLDSLGFVTLIVAIEQKMEENVGVMISLTDEIVVSHNDDPFETVGTLCDYILSSLEGTECGQERT